MDHKISALNNRLQLLYDYTKLLAENAIENIEKISIESINKYNRLGIAVTTFTCDKTSVERYAIGAALDE